MSQLAASPYVVIGAGMHGLSTAYHLAKELRLRGAGSGADVVVLDKSKPGAGASGIACGVVRNNYFQPAMSELMQACVEVWESDPAAYHYNAVGYIALGQRLDFVRADPIDEPIEVFPDSGLGSATVGRFEKHVDGLVELRSGCFHVPQFESLLPGLEMSLGLRDQVGDRISGWFAGLRWRWNVLGGWLCRRSGGCFTECRAATRKQDDRRHDDRQASELAR